MAVTIGSLLQLDILKDAQVIVGADGLDHIVQFVDVLEVPDIGKWAKANTVYFTTAYPFSEQTESFVRTIESFIEHDVSGLFIKLGRFIEQIPKEIFALANEHHFPIIILPSEMIYSPVITEVARTLFEDEAKKERAKHQFHSKLHDLLMDNQGLHLIGKALADEISAEVFIANKTQQLVYSTGKEQFLQFYYNKPWDGQQENSYEQLRYFYYQNRTILRMPAYIGSEFQGNLICIMEGNAQITEELYDLFKRCAVVVAVELSREEANNEHRIQQEQALLRMIIEQNDLDVMRLIDKMHSIDWEVSNWHFFAEITISFKHEYAISRQVLDQNLQKLFYQLTNQLRQDGVRAIIGKENDHMTCLFNLSLQQKEPILWMTKWLKDFLDGAQKDFQDFYISIGISKKTISIEQLKKSYAEAQKALRIGRKAYGLGGIYDFEKMGVYKILFTHGNGESLMEFYQDYLEPLVQYDQKHGSQLVDTVEKYWENGSNALATAEQLYIHRNTLHYRLKRASQILGYDLELVENKQCIGLAFKLRKLLNL